MGALFWNEFDGFEVWQYVVFSAGVLCVMIGVLLLQQREIISTDEHGIEGMQGIAPNGPGSVHKYTQFRPRLATLLVPSASSFCSIAYSAFPTKRLALQAASWEIVIVSVILLADGHTALLRFLFCFYSILFFIFV